MLKIHANEYCSKFCSASRLNQCSPFSFPTRHSLFIVCATMRRGHLCNHSLRRCRRRININCLRANCFELCFIIVCSNWRHTGHAIHWNTYEFCGRALGVLVSLTRWLSASHYRIQYLLSFFAITSLFHCNQFAQMALSHSIWRVWMHISLPRLQSTVWLDFICKYLYSTVCDFRFGHLYSILASHDHTTNEAERTRVERNENRSSLHGRPEFWRF